MATLFDHPKYLKDQLCTITVNEAILGFKSAYTKFMGQKPSKETLCILVSQSVLETGWFKQGLHCWNFGNTRCNIQTLGDEEYFTMFKCSEILKNKTTGKKEEVWFYPPDPQSVFQGFKTMEEGIKHHIKFLSTKDRYQEAWKAAVRCDKENYIHLLCKGGYFTANEDLYKKVFLNIYNKIILKIESEEKEIFSEKERKDIEMIVVDSIWKTIRNQ